MATLKYIHTSSRLVWLFFLLRLLTYKITLPIINRAATNTTSIIRETCKLSICIVLLTVLVLFMLRAIEGVCQLTVSSGLCEVKRYFFTCCSKKSKTKYIWLTAVGCQMWFVSRQGFVFEQNVRIS